MPESSSLLKILILLSLVLAIPSAFVYSQQQNLAFETLSVEHGMPTAVMCILQDGTGYLWFGTYGGLYRYDGYSFVSYKHDFDDSTSIADNRISTLYEDKAGVLWIGSSSGLERFDRTTGTFMHYAPNPSGAVEGATNYVGAICEDKRGILWVGTEWGLCQFDRTTGTFSSLRHDSTDPGSIAHNSVNAIYEDKEGSLWFATGGGLDRYDFATAKFVHCWYDSGKQHAPRDTTGSQYWINSLCEDNNGALWLGTEEGLVEFNPKEGTFSHYRHNPKGLHNRIYSICQDVMTGSLWAATGRVLLSFDRQSRAFAQYEYRTNAVCSERSGTFWAGTDTYIQKLNRSKQPFKKYPMNDIVYVVKSGREGILWLFTSKRYKKFDIQKEELVPCSFGKDSVLFVYNSGGDVLLYSEGGILSTIDSLGVRHVWGPYSRDVVRSVSVTWKSSKGFWIGTRSGNLWFIDPKSRSLTEVKNVKLRIRYIYEDATGLVWIATYMGKLFCYNQDRDTIVEFVSEPGNPGTISGKQIHEIYEDTKRRLWFVTNNGLNRFDRSTNSFIRFYEKDGLPSTDILGILEDDHGCLWISSNKGISKLNPETHQVKHYDVSYGLEPTADISFGKGCKTGNGEMYFGGAGGLTRFHPDSVKDNPFVPPIVITSFKKFDKPAPLTSDVRLPYDENFIAFEFAALSYISPERNQYAYKMEGLDKDWVYSGTRRYASYPGLEPGKYTLRVKGSNNDGVWNEAGTSIAVFISPPWWKTAWAYILASLLLLSLLYAAWKMQVKSIRMGHAYEMSRFEARQAARSG